MHEIVLFNDEQEALQRLLQAVLIQEGKVVLAARDGHEAVSLATAPQVDAVILDSTMPGITGFDAAARIKRLRPETPVLMFSSAPHPLQRAMRHCDAFVSKSDGIDALLTTLSRMVSPSGGQKPPVRRFPRYHVRLPFLVVVDRAGELNVMRGTTVSVGEGGMGGKVEGKLQPGELVLLQVSESLRQVFSEPRAQVRYCGDEVCGFEFLDVTPTQRSEVRRVCERLATA